MKKLMLSLDKKILDSASPVAKRMIEYGKTDELFIVIPGREEKHFDLSPTVHIRSTGGNKLQQLFRLKKFGLLAIKKGGAESITTQDPFLTGKVGVFLKKKTGKKLEVQLHGDFFGSSYYKESSTKNLIFYHIGKKVIKKADRLRVVGERIKKSLLDFGIEENMIEVRSIAVDVEKLKNSQPKFDLHQKYPKYKKIFLVLSRLEPIKNVGWLVDLWSEIDTDKLLLIVGSGSQADLLQQKAVNHENIKFEDWTDDHVSYLKAADCLLFPSVSEGYGLAPMEASIVGTPVIMNDVGVANCELRSSEKAKVIPLANLQDWVEAINKI